VRYPNRSDVSTAKIFDAPGAALSDPRAIRPVSLAGASVPPRHRRSIDPNGQLPQPTFIKHPHNTVPQVAASRGWLSMLRFRFFLDDPPNRSATLVPKVSVPPPLDSTYYSSEQIESRSMGLRSDCAALVKQRRSPSTRSVETSCVPLKRGRSSRGCCDPSSRVLSPCGTHSFIWRYRA
jgi:hypothetical protein